MNLANFVNDFLFPLPRILEDLESGDAVVPSGATAIFFTECECEGVAVPAPDDRSGSITNALVDPVLICQKGSEDAADGSPE